MYDDYHPNNVNHQNIAAAVAEYLVANIPKASLSADNLSWDVSVNDPLNLVGGTDPQGSYTAGAIYGVTPTRTMVSDTSGALSSGKWAEWDIDATSNTGCGRILNLTGSYQVGDRVLLTGKLRIIDISGTWVQTRAVNNPSTASFSAR